MFATKRFSVSQNGRVMWGASTKTAQNRWPQGRHHFWSVCHDTPVTTAEQHQNPGVDREVTAHRPQILLRNEVPAFAIICWVKIPSKTWHLDHRTQPIGFGHTYKHAENPQLFGSNLKASILLQYSQYFSRVPCVSSLLLLHSFCLPCFSQFWQSVLLTTDADTLAIPLPDSWEHPHPVPVRRMDLCTFNCILLMKRQHFDPDGHGQSTTQKALGTKVSCWVPVGPDHPTQPLPLTPPPPSDLY